MNFHPLNKSYSRTRRPRAFAWVVGCVIVILTINHFSHGAVSAVVRTHTAAVFGTGGVIEHMLDPIRASMHAKRSLERDNERLAARIQELELYALNNQVLQDENAELRSLFTTSPPARAGVLESVRSSIGAFPYGTFLISRTHSPSVVVGAYVATAQSIILGTIARVDADIATVELFSAPARETHALIGVGDSQTAVVLTGIGMGNMRTSIARDVPVQVGDVVRLASFPEGIIGVVGSIDTKPSDAFQLVHVFVPLRLDQVEYVTVGSL